MRVELGRGTGKCASDGGGDPTADRGRKSMSACFYPKGKCGACSYYEFCYSEKGMKARE